MNKCCAQLIAWLVVGALACDGEKTSSSGAGTSARDAKANQAPPPPSPKIGKEAAIVVPIETLVTAWDGNQLRADKTYKGKLVETEGRVGSVFDQGGPTVWLDGPDDRKVVCGGVNGDDAAKLKIGSTITIRGVVKGRLNTGGATSPHLSPGEIVTAPKPGP